MKKLEEIKWLKQKIKETEEAKQDSHFKHHFDFRINLYKERLMELVNRG